ncbi:MAG TPA: alpha/beta hydrolase [Devosia sp.]|nr:alpha/beta hydrolase [Devosia sp.]
MPQFAHDRASVHYEITGSGPPLLLVAGIASDSASWGPLLPLLSNRRLILVDNRGSGQTRVEGPIELDEMAADCAALVDHLGLGTVDVAGHSLGGYVALALAAKHPERVRRLVTMATGAISAPARVLFHDLARLYFTLPPEDWFRLLYQWLFSGAFFADEATVARAAAASASYAHRQSPGDFARQVAAIDRYPGVDLAAIACPVLALVAERDLLARDDAVASMHAPIRDCRLLTISGAAHSIHWEQPHAVATAIDEFLG